MDAKHTIYVATGNPGKLREFARLTDRFDAKVLTLPGLGTMPEPVENAETFAGNAALKARAYSRLAPGLLVLADDSGLEVDALSGAPGVRSARYADDLGYTAVPPENPVPALDPATKDGRNNLCLLDALRKAGGTPHRARFRCALALARDGEVLGEADGSVEGEILTQPRGANGFGYDPLFLLPDLGLTAAELTPEQKWQRSHRGAAFRRLMTTWLGDS